MLPLLWSVSPRPACSGRQRGFSSRRLGHVMFNDDGDDITVCDKRADGYGASTGYLSDSTATAPAWFVIKEDDAAETPAATGPTMATT
ncbi:hypothetical protein LV779_22640 [Streptomyces thinghirensis]|nr:hypothetical protein [Streptomyces thinghirensis]